MHYNLVKASNRRYLEELKNRGPADLEGKIATLEKEMENFKITK